MTDRTRPKSPWWRSELPQYLLIIAALLAFRSSFADHYVVPSGSMEYTLMVGDRVVVDKTAYGVQVPFTDIEVFDGERVTRGEVVIFDSPRDGKRLIKRIVAVEGDEVLIADGRIVINGEPLATAPTTESYDARVARLNLEHGGGPDVYVESVPPGMVLAVGDHRGNSLDGRAFGFVDEREIYGRAIAVYYRRGERFVWKPL